MKNEFQATGFLIDPEKGCIDIMHIENSPGNNSRRAVDREGKSYLIPHGCSDHLIFVEEHQTSSHPDATVNKENTQTLSKLLAIATPAPSS